MDLFEDTIKMITLMDEINYGPIRKPPNPEPYGKRTKMSVMLEAIEGIGRTAEHNQD